ncbi:MAG: type VI secretion system ATPase TssH [Sulfuricurvum sp.]|uniref:type VI secretion system ATPase TssH n=1 Tax=Sulfuricurvum sp. TaxID=2025608 RepID=UPI00262FA932|nr:type VI secretion system ATPase TssH [Sulfuricurvum sp.]MDD5158797.1 type VI secretion system ATPase TssH [Sulfuricurvum sp.]
MKIELKKLIETLDAIAKQNLQNAAQRCIIRGGGEILIEDLLFVMLENEYSLLNGLLKHYEIAPEKMLKALQNGVKSHNSESSSPVFSSALIQWLEDAYMLAKLEMELNEINESVLMMSLLQNGAKYSNTAYFKILETVDVAQAYTLIEGLTTEAAQSARSKPSAKSSMSTSGEDLEKYTTDMTELAAEGKIDPVLCRDDEIRQAIDILLRRRKNNPILVGEAGVGKTAVVEGLALKIINQDVPIQLYGAKVLSLDLGAMQAGASVKGEFERRLQSVINAIQSSTQFIILFIDESHTLIGAGGNEGGSDAANLLKPALARGELRTIAATTWLEYRKYFEKDPALSRRFQKINLLEPSVEYAVTILRGIAHKYEQEHDVYIEDAAIQAAAALSARYITGRQLPDKAIDVLDTACANVKISKTNRPYAISRLENEKLKITQEIDLLSRDEGNGLKDYSKRIKHLNAEIRQLDKELKKSEIEYEKQKKLVEEIATLRILGKKEGAAKEHQKLLAMQEQCRYVYDNVTAEQVAEVISSWTGIPLGNMVREQAKNLMTLQEQMTQRVIGQDQAIKYLNTFLQISAAGLKNENAPTGVFLLVGPSGVGKTETARAIADLLYGGEQFLTTINMTEFQEKHTVSRLIGSPPGYVGYGDGGQLTDPVRIKPYSVVLFDEIEKAHPDILNLFYQIFDKGTVNDGEGRAIDFKNTIILMTSNLATDAITQICGEYDNVELEPLTNAILPILSDYLKPALLGRMNVIPYMNLSREALKEIITLKLKRIEKQLAVREIGFKYDDALLDHIVALSNARDTGARNIELIINTNLMPKLAQEVLKCSVENIPLHSIRVSMDKNKEISIKGA